MASPVLVDILLGAVRGRAETTLLELFAALEFPPEKPSLEKVAEVQEFLSKHGLELVPGIDTGSLETIRSLRLADSFVLTAEIAKQEIEQDESNRLEFKSTLEFDLAKAQHSKTATLKELRSPGVLHATLKTIDAFLTSDGGFIYLGVDDKGNVIGIEPDFAFLKSHQQNRDGWELHLRDIVDGNFRDGGVINDHIQVCFVELDGKYVARIEVFKRRPLSFLRSEDGSRFELYRRQGNRTIQVAIEEVEEFIAFRLSEKPY